METVVVLGASPKEDRYSNKAMKMLADHDHTPIPVAPGHAEIEGRKAYAKLADVPDKIDTVTLYMGPKRQDEALIEQVIQAAPRRVIFNPGTENNSAQERLEKAGIQVVEACTLVLLSTNQY